MVLTMSMSGIVTVNTTSEDVGKRRRISLSKRAQDEKFLVMFSGGGVFHKVSWISV